MWVVGYSHGNEIVDPLYHRVGVRCALGRLGPAPLGG